MREKRKNGERYLLYAKGIGSILLCIVLLLCTIIPYLNVAAADRTGDFSEAGVSIPSGTYHSATELTQSELESGDYLIYFVTGGVPYLLYYENGTVKCKAFDGNVYRLASSGEVYFTDTVNNSNAVWNVTVSDAASGSATVQNGSYGYLNIGGSVKLASTSQTMEISQKDENRGFRIVGSDNYYLRGETGGTIFTNKTNSTTFYMAKIGENVSFQNITVHYVDSAGNDIGGTDTLLVDSTSWTTLSAYAKSIDGYSYSEARLSDATTGTRVLRVNGSGYIGDDISEVSWRSTVSVDLYLIYETKNSSIAFTSVGIKDSTGESEALSGVTYTIYDSDGNTIATATSGGESIGNTGFDFSGLSMDQSLTYTVKQTSVPEGYILSSEVWNLSVTDGTWTLTDSAGASVSTIYNYAEDSVTYSKTAEVEDYKNRVYEVELKADAPTGTYSEDLDVVFVVDNSNSMLFPSTLEATDYAIELTKNNLDELAEDTNSTGPFYVISEATTKATVYRIWKASDGIWYYTDASVYAKDGEAGTKYKITTNDVHKLANADDGVYTIYTDADSGRTRLDYLQSSLTSVISTLANLSPNSQVGLVQFNMEASAPLGNTLLELTTDNVTQINAKINQITTDGGTNHYAGLAKAHEYLQTATTDGRKKVVILITDGALNAGSEVTAADVESAATVIKETDDALLVTIGLSLGNVTSAKDLMTAIASRSDLALQAENGSDIEACMNQILAMLTTTSGALTGSVTDYVSESFYPVYKDATGEWTALTEGNWITLDGSLTTEGAADAAGQVCYDSAQGLYYIAWNNQQIQDWKGIVYIKAKEDFIGGNAIQTNSSATLLVEGSKTYTYDVPTVNVKLLSLSKSSSEQTIYLGDSIDYITEIQELYGKIQVAELVDSDGKSVVNDSTRSAVTVSLADIGISLTDAEWTSLSEGTDVTKEYTYSAAEGAVGVFTFSLTSDTTDSDKYTYTLQVTYTAYELGEDGRPASNAYNGEAGPGTELSSSNNNKTLQSNNVHTVKVIKGSIVLKKELDTAADADTTFTFQITNGTDTQEVTLTVKKGETESKTVVVNDLTDESATSPNLARGEYEITEINVDTSYEMTGITVGSGTDCYSKISDDNTKVTLGMGYDTSNTDVISNGEYRGGGVKGVVTISNSKKYELPATGGRGTSRFGYSGLLMISGAAICAGILRHRRTCKNKSMKG